MTRPTSQDHRFRDTLDLIQNCLGIEARFGPQKRALMLRRLQVTEAIFKDPDAPISGRFALDI
ncbi:MAG: hypothetical protein H7222_18180 [Methylotenera sp.]|nr:hypothetical protein [Oligoflexia bacterium]